MNINKFRITTRLRFSEVEALVLSLGYFVLRISFESFAERFPQHAQTFLLRVNRFF